MLHKNSAPGNIHTLVNWEVADSAALTALVLDGSDIYKLAFQLDTSEIKMLTNDIGPVWQTVANANALVLDHNDLTNIGTNTHDDIDTFIASASPILAGLGSTYQPLDAQLTDFSGLSYATNALKVLRVNAGETGLEWATGGGGGGLTHITESLTIAAPNATINTVNLVVTGGSTNADFVLASKGTGALLRRIPDNTAAGGNKRGTHAVDLQTDRFAANEVASGSSSCVPGGQRNIASGSYAFAMGQINIASGGHTVVFGQQSTGSGQYSFTFGLTCTNASTGGFVGGSNCSTAAATQAFAYGASCQANSNQSVAMGLQSISSGQYAFSIGRQNTASAFAGVALGYQSADRGLWSSIAQGNGQIASLGDSQVRRSILGRVTTNATPTELTADRAGAAATSILILPNNSAYLVRGNLIGRNTATNDTVGIEFKGVIKRGANAASTNIPTAFVQADISRDAGAAAWVLALTADTTLGGLSVDVTGEAAKTIRWVCQVTSVEVG